MDHNKEYLKYKQNYWRNQYKWIEQHSVHHVHTLTINKRWNKNTFQRQSFTQNSNQLRKLYDPNKESNFI